MAEQKAQGVAFTPDTNILLNLIFDEYAKRDAIDQYNDAMAMPEGLDKNKSLFQVTQYLYDRPFYMLLKELIKSGKITMDISPIVYSEIINSKKLDEDIRSTIQVSMLNMARDGKNARTILTPSITNQAFQYYINERFGSPEKLQKSVGSKNLVAYIYALKENFQKDLINDAVAKKDDYIYKTRKQLVKIIKQDLIKTKLEALGGTVRFMTLAETVDGKETPFRECIYALADSYRINQGEIDKRQSVPQSELNDSLIMAIGSRCNIAVVTNDQKGLIASKKHIHKTNDKHREKYGVLITGEPVKLEEFLVRNFPEEVLSFSTRYKPIPSLDAIDQNGEERLGSLAHAVKGIRESKQKMSYAEGSREKQYKDVKLGRELKLVGLEEFFGAFQDSREYSRFVDSVKIARDREKDTFKDSIASLQNEVNASLKELKYMIYGVQEYKGRIEPSKTHSLAAIANQAQSTYRLLLIYATHIYNDLMGSKKHGKFDDYKKIVESLGIKVLVPSKSDEKKGRRLTIVINGVKFAGAYDNENGPSPLKVALTKNMSDEMVLLGLSNEETRPVMLKRNESYFGTRFQSIGNQYKKLPSYYSGHSFSEVTTLKPTESETATRYKDNISRLSRQVELEM